MKRLNCIFCNKPLNKSSEHIIPHCLNGRLTSTNVACSDCNSLFGQTIDSEIKEQLNALMLFMGFGNAQQIHVKAPDNKDYLLKKNLSLQLIRPEVHINERNRIISVTGGKKKDIDSVLRKMNKILENELRIKSMKFVAGTPVQSIGTIPGTHTHFEPKITNSIILLFNKIALEYFSLYSESLELVKELLHRVYNLDQHLDNVIFCNAKNEIRDFTSSEISHLIVLSGNSNDRKLRVYIELMNIFCGIITLSDDYTGENIYHTYYQDAKTGAKIEKAPDLKILLTKELNFVPSGNLSELASLLSERDKERFIDEIFDINLKEIMKELKAKAEQGLIKKSDIELMFVQQASFLYAQVAFQIPYSVELEEGKLPEDNMQYNFYYSNFKPEMVDHFIDSNKHLLNIKILINNEMYQFISFYKENYMVKKNTILIKVYAVLQSLDTTQKRYVPIREMFEILQNAKPLES